MEQEKKLEYTTKMLNRFQKGKEDVMGVYMGDNNILYHAEKGKRDRYSSGRVIIIKNGKKVVDGNYKYNEKVSSFPRKFQACIREGEDSRCKMIFSYEETGVNWELCGFGTREEKDDQYTIFLHCVEENIGGYLWVGQNDEAGVVCFDYLCFDGIGSQLIDNILSRFSENESKDEQLVKVEQLKEVNLNAN